MFLLILRAIAQTLSKMDPIAFHTTYTLPLIEIILDFGTVLTCLCRALIWSCQVNNLAFRADMFLCVHERSSPLGP